MDEIKPEKDEIRFIELLATLIRRRRWLYWFAGVGIFFGLVLLFVLPAFGLNLFDSAKYTVEARIQAVLVPDGFRNFAAFDLEAMAMDQLRNSAVVGDIYQQTLLHDTSIMSDKPRFNQTVRQFSSRDLTLAPDPKIGSIQVSVRVSFEDQERGRKFVSLLAERIRQIVSDKTVPTILETMKSLRNLKGSGEVAVQQTVDMQLRADVLEALVSNPNFPIRLETEPELFRVPGPSRGLIMILIAIGSVVLGILAAFVAEGVVRTRSNADNMDLLRRAWRER